MQNFAHSERRNGTSSIEGSIPAIKSETHGRSLIVEFFRIGTTISTYDFYKRFQVNTTGKNNEFTRYLFLWLNFEDRASVFYI